MDEELKEREDSRKKITKELINLLNQINASNMSNKAKKMSTSAVLYCLSGLKDEK